ncbi:5-amino-6-(5-phosphoribosylamino)uracil reductase [Streptomyces sp. WAC 01529]|uniref:dihydrofolate reductase family protein n=1 Tax=Streptomyces sp. WAC 01529 TaxID=2203205 RepID=UPI000F6D9EF4|nr:dihydrofolate reductase family protein [Streptomyces sp. WAC 01529]AZM51956.1 5-amino-6-(5-phosphoribosylamino)uracil reductase [Streptomyces sp. WAC 01529]
MARPHVLLSAAVSLDGCLDTRPGEGRLLLSGEEDFERVVSERASSDAVLVGAGTLRADDPRLRVRARAPREHPLREHPLHEHPLKVTITRSGDLDRAWRFWHHGGPKAVYAVGAEARRRAVAALGDLAEVYEVTGSGTWEAVLDHLHTLGVRRLMVEGGGQIHTQLLRQGLADELQLVVAPLLVGQADAPRMLGPGPYPGGPPHRHTLVDTRRIGDVVLLRYALNRRPGTDERATAADLAWLAEACELAALCPPSRSAFSVGAVIVAADGERLAQGHSREGGDSRVHAEEAALAKVAGDPRLRGATIYSSLEPCAKRASRPRSCARLIIDSGLRRVVTAWREPDTFVVAADGAGLLRASGVCLAEIEQHAEAARAPNAHLPQ